MSWSRAIVLALVAVAVGACGFRPLYGGGRDGLAAAELAAIRIDPIDDRIGQQLHNELLDRLAPTGRPANADYVLRVTLREGVQRLAVSKTELATRANLRVTAHYQLLDGRNRALLMEDTKTVVSSYNIVSAEFAALANEKDARARALQEMADEIRTRLAVYFVQRRTASETPAP